MQCAVCTLKVLPIKFNWHSENEENIFQDFVPLVCASSFSAFHFCLCFLLAVATIAAAAAAAIIVISNWIFPYFHF